MNPDMKREKDKPKIKRELLKEIGKQVLRKSEEKYRSLYESSKDGIAFLDMQGNLLDANQDFLDMFGYTKEEFKKMSYQHLTPEK